MPTFLCRGPTSWAMRASGGRVAAGWQVMGRLEAAAAASVIVVDVVVVAADAPLLILTSGARHCAHEMPLHEQ